MAELVDALDSGSSRGNLVDVRVILAAIGDHIMRTALIAHGEISDLNQLLSSLEKFDRIIAIDGGLHYCHQIDVCPELIIGDFDSVDASLLDRYSKTPKIRFPVYKDETDLEIAIKEALTSTTDQLTVFGATGKKTDQTLYNLYLLTRYLGKLQFESEKEIIYALPHSIKINTFPGQILSFLPLGEAAIGITSQGLRWELKEATFNNHFMSISNEALSNEVALTFRKGHLICFLHKE